MSRWPAPLEPGDRPNDDVWYENKRSPVSTAQQDVQDYQGRHREVEGQLTLPFEGEPTVKEEGPRQHEFVTGFALAKTPQGDWVFVGDITHVLDIERTPSDDEVRHGASEAAEYLRLTRLVGMLQGAQPHTH